MIDHSDEFSPYTSTLYHKQTLKSLSRKRFFIVDEYRKGKLVLNNLIQITFPEMKSLFSNIYGESALAILKEYGTPKKLAKAHISKVDSLLHGRCKCSAADIIEAAKHSVGISDDCYAFEITDAIENLEFIQRRIEKYDAVKKGFTLSSLCPFSGRKSCSPARSCF